MSSSGPIADHSPGPTSAENDEPPAEPDSAAATPATDGNAADPSDDEARVPRIPMRPLPSPDTPTSSEPVADTPVAGGDLPSAPTSARRSKPVAGQGRIVKERLRHISPLSVLKMAAIFYTCAALVMLVTSVLLWQFARSSGTVDDMESFVSQLFTYGDCVSPDDLELGQEFTVEDRCPEGQVMVGGFQISDAALFRAVLLSGGLFVVVATVGTVFMALLFNLLSDVTGGVRYSVVREPQDPGGRRSGSPRHRSRR